MYKKIILVLFIWANYAIANDIYIQQAGDSLNLDIVQDGQNNVIGTSTTAVALSGDDMTFDITQTGSYNTISATIKGATYTGTWSFTGDSNTVDLLCSSAATGSCDTVTLNITTTGDDNDYTIRIGETSASDSATVNFTLTGDNNIMTPTINGESAVLTVVVDNSSSLSTNSANLDEGVAITTSQSGDGDLNGHTIDVNVTGGGGTIDITQSGVYDNYVDLDITGDDFDVDITQSD